MDLDPGGLGWMWTQRIGKRRIHTTDLGLGDPLTGPGSNVAALRIWDPGAHLPARHGFGSGDPFTAQKNYRGPYNVDVVNRKTTPRWPNTVSCSLRCPTEPSCICIYIYASSLTSDVCDVIALLSDNCLKLGMAFHMTYHHVRCLALPDLLHVGRPHDCHLYRWEECFVYSLLR